MTTLILRRDEVSRLRAGDRITAIDGRPLPGEYTVTGRLTPVRPGGARAVPMRLTGRADPVNLYPDTHINSSVTVERTVRPGVRYVDGVKLVNETRDGLSGWWTPGGRYCLGYGFGGYSECEAPHPMRSGGQCPGMQFHEYDEWHVWVDGEPEPDASGATFAEMAPRMVALYRQDGSR